MKPDRVVVLRLYDRNPDHKVVIDWIENKISRDSRGRPNIAPALMDALLKHIGSRSATQGTPAMDNNLTSGRRRVEARVDAIPSAPVVIPDAEDVLPVIPDLKDTASVDKGNEKPNSERFSSFVLDVQRQLEGGT